MVQAWNLKRVHICIISFHAELFDMKGDVLLTFRELMLIFQDISLKYINKILRKANFILVFQCKQKIPDFTQATEGPNVFEITQRRVAESL